MRFHTQDLTIRDEYGRERIFKGVNLCFKSEQQKRKWKRWIDELLPAMQKNGINILRLGVTWEIIEPSENQYNAEAIKMLKGIVKYCEEQGVYVLLDMHQDLFTTIHKIGDGAPKWAIDKSIQFKKPMAIWAEGYFYMDSVQEAFYNFWTNKDGIQDKFIRMWKYYARQFDEFSNIIGYDYLNEPFLDGNGRTIFLTLVERLLKASLDEDIQLEPYFKKYSNRKAFAKTVAKIATTVKSPSRFKKMMTDFEDYDTFGSLIKGADEYVKAFNEKYYQPFFSRIKNEVEGECFNFFEHSYWSNMGIPASIDTSEGDIYSPHAYDVFIDTPMYNRSSTDRIRYILDGIKANQAKMQAPVIFGEWGGGCRFGTGWIRHIDYVYRIMEQNKWSSIYWGYNFTDKKFIKVINRPYPIAVCGDIIEYHSDSEARTFSLKWQQDKEYPMPTEIYSPSGIIKTDGKIGINEISIKY